MFIIFLLYICYHFVLKIKQFFLLHTKLHNIFNYFQRTAYTLCWFARFKGKQTPNKISSPLFVIVNRSYIGTFYDNTCRYK